MTDQEHFYSERIHVHQLALEKAKKQHRLFSIARLTVFLLMPLSWYLLGWSWLLFGVLVVEIVVFVMCVHRWLDAKIEKEKHELYIQLNRNELALLEGNWSNFEDGIEFKSGQHPFANDMDLFGPKSVFQYTNRTVLPLGKQRLAQTLAYGAEDPSLNETMIREFTSQSEWSQRFIVESKVYLKDEQRQKTLDQLKEFTFNKSRLLVLRWILPVVVISSLVLYNLDMIKFGHLFLIGIGALGLIATQLKKTNEWMNLLSNRSEKIAALEQQFRMFQSVDLTSEAGQKFKKSVVDSSGMMEGLKELIVIRKRAEYRMNAIVGLLLNYLFAWDFHLLHKSQKWHSKYGVNVHLWEKQLAEVEVWISGGIYAFNRGQVCYATFNSDGNFNCSDLSHPFVATNKQVSNHFTLDASKSFLIITGPNMAGKSTYLRSVGLAIVSANAGFPILATRCEMPSVKLYSSMRTSDDLTVESSYFHAELMRLRFIVDAIEAGEQVFVILDEILKGTNSKDKEQGSAAFMEKLNKIGAKGIIATHDLSLTNLAQPDSAFKNVYFDSTIEGENLYFDYKIRDGVCKNMNASFLLKQMDLV